MHRSFLDEKLKRLFRFWTTNRKTIELRCKMCVCVPYEKRADLKIYYRKSYKISKRLLRQLINTNNGFRLLLIERFKLDTGHINSWV